MIPLALNYSGLLSSHSKSKTWITHSFSHARTQRKVLFSLSNEGWCAQAFTTSFQDLPIVSPALLASQKWAVLYWLFISGKQLWNRTVRKEVSPDFVNTGKMLKKNEKWRHLKHLLHLNDHCDTKQKRGKGKKGPLLSFIWRIKIPPHWYFNCNSWDLFVLQKPPSELSKHTGPAHAQQTFKHFAATESGARNLILFTLKAQVTPENIMQV